jgi:hypothetical protein
VEENEHLGKEKAGEKGTMHSLCDFSLYDAFLSIAITEILEYL